MRKPSETEVLATTIPDATYTGWYCPNHPPGEKLANDAAADTCWGCGWDRPGHLYIAAWGDAKKDGA